MFDLITPLATPWLTMPGEVQNVAGTALTAGAAAGLVMIGVIWIVDAWTKRGWKK